MQITRSHRALQIVLASLALIPMLTSMLVLMGVDNLEYEALKLPKDAMFDSNLRFFGGLWLGFGLTVLWMLPRLREPRVKTMFSAIVVMLWLGGVGRVLSMVFIGMPPAPIVAVTVLELVGMPLIWLWHGTLFGKGIA